MPQYLSAHNYHFHLTTDLSLYLLDLSTGSDTINHHILLQRLEHFIVIKGTALSFKSYLSGFSLYTTPP